MAASGGNRLLTYLLAFLGGVAGALLGWIVTGFLADFVLGLQGMSEREGGRAMVAFFAVAPFGALAGLIAGVWLVLRYQGGYRGFANLAGRGALVIAGIGAAVALGLWGYIGSHDILAKKGPPPQAKFEIRLPANAVLPANLEGLSIDLNTTRNTMPATLGGARNDGGRPVIPGAVDLYFRATSRILVLRLPGEPDRLFVLKLAGNPGAQAEFGPWQRVDYVDDHPGKRRARAVKATTTRSDTGSSGPIDCQITR